MWETFRCDEMFVKDHLLATGFASRIAGDTLHGRNTTTETMTWNGLAVAGCRLKEKEAF